MKIVKILVSLCAIIGLLVSLTGCPTVANGENSETSTSGNPSTPNVGNNVTPHGMVNFTFFDTVSYIYSYAGDSKEDFENNANKVFEVLGEYHELFDIYYEHSGVTNLCTLNKNAGGAAMVVDEKLIDFLLYAKELYETTNGEMNVMMGSVLSLWHDAREAKTINGLYCSYCRKFSPVENCVDNKCPQTDPDAEKGSDEKCQRPVVTFEYELEQRSKHVSFDSLEIDVENCTVRITDPDASIDVGALGKGYATEMAAKYLKSIGIGSYVLNIGGNIRIVGTKVDGSGWGTGIKNPANTDKYSIILTLANTSCVTSGDYERFFTVGGKKYHHIIDKDTLMPAEYFSSVSIITENSALADALSTALFSMSYEEGKAIVEKIGNVDVIWISRNGEVKYTDGIEALIRK